LTQQVAIVIPIYKEEMNDFEKKSFQQCLSVLGGHPIVVVKPKSLMLNSLKEHYPQLQFNDFPDHFFKGIQGYNNLMISVDFYKAFLDFEYILIYQLDAYVFEDRLIEWCNKGYDYIGAPHIEPDRWVVGGKNPGNYFEGRRVFMNGGFSLRKVNPIIRLLKVLDFVGQRWISNEDGLYSLHFIRLWPFRPLMNLPNWQEALEFSMEQYPDLCYKLNQERLPFGCHAWEKYDYAFWKPFMNEK